MVMDLLRSENANSRRTTGLSGMLMRCAKFLVGGVLVNAEQTGHQVGGTGKGNDGWTCPHVGQCWRKRQEKPGQPS